MGICSAFLGPPEEGHSHHTVFCLYPLWPDPASESPGYTGRIRVVTLFVPRSTPCPSVKHGDEWGEPSRCDGGDNCQYCHSRTEQQFHPEVGTRAGPAGWLGSFVAWERVGLGSIVLAVSEGPHCHSGVQWLIERAHGTWRRPLVTAGSLY
jgi:hypothetical protein